MVLPGEVTADGRRRAGRQHGCAPTLSGPCADTFRLAFTLQLSSTFTFPLSAQKAAWNVGCQRSQTDAGLSTPSTHPQLACALTISRHFIARAPRSDGNETPVPESASNRPVQADRGSAVGFPCNDGPRAANDAGCVDDAALVWIRRQTRDRHLARPDVSAAGAH
eukprot:2649939-Rhodomonas_salina.3